MYSLTWYKHSHKLLSHLPSIFLAVFCSLLYEIILLGHCIPAHTSFEPNLYISCEAYLQSDNIEDLDRRMTRLLTETLDMRYNVKKCPHLHLRLEAPHTLIMLDNIGIASDLPLEHKASD